MTGHRHVHSEGLKCCFEILSSKPVPGMGHRMARVCRISCGEASCGLWNMYVGIVAASVSASSSAHAEGPVSSLSPESD